MAYQHRAASAKQFFAVDRGFRRIPSQPPFRIRGHGYRLGFVGSGLVNHLSGKCNNNYSHYNTGREYRQIVKCARRCGQVLMEVNAVAPPQA